MIEIDLSGFLRFLEQFTYMSPAEATWVIFYRYYGWAFYLFIIFRYMFWPMWLLDRQNIWGATINYVLLAIDVPRNNETSIQAMEDFFIHLLGAHGSRTKWEEWWKGQFQLSFSLELISIDGHIQFIVRTPAAYRDMV